MREDHAPLRGEAARVAARVRELIGTADEPLDLGPQDDDLTGLGRRRGRTRPGLADRLAARFPVRVDPGRRATLAMGAAVLVAAVATGAWVMSSRPRPVALSATPALSAGSRLPGTVPLSLPASSPGALPSPSAVPSTSAGGEVVVDIAGRVRRPGLYHLPAGSRIDDAITAAGGARRGVDLTDLNLAALLADGQQIVVGPHAGVIGGVAGAPGTASAGADGSSAAAGPVSLNTATLEQLETLPRIGPVTAQKILDYRAQHGSFTSIDQLKDVSGIGDVTFAGLAPLVTL